MPEFKSSYQIVREKLEQEGRITILSEDETSTIIYSINAEVAANEADLNRKNVEAVKELSDIVLNA